MSPVGADVTPVLRGVFRGVRGAHPEIWSRWPQIAGREIARRAVPRSLRGGTLVLAVSSSVWMQELTYMKQRLLDAVADAVGPGVVRDVRLVLDPQVGATRRR